MHESGTPLLHVCPTASRLLDYFAITQTIQAVEGWPRGQRVTLVLYGWTQKR